jgi:puromycin-sensitive aminopeptidase
MSDGPNPIRLSRRVVPERYDLTLTPDLGAFTFRGEETITVSVLEPIREVVLNAAELQFQSVVVEDGQGRCLAAQVRLDEAAERAHLAFDEPLAPGAWRLRIAFTGLLNDKLHGFYRSTYALPTDGPPPPDAPRGVLAVTQFEATDARRAFPCWDEPDCKAVFQVTLVVDEGLEAISNTAVLRARPAGQGKRAVTFAPTIRMSTYLVAFVVGRLEATAPVFADGVPVRVWAVPGKGRLAAFALEAAGFSVSFFRDYFGLPYPGDKLDLIAIPDFAFGAMENLGAITFRETALLVEEGKATHAELTRVAHVVMHEIAHMWFGDLVTMGWWNGLWLNEAFATFMEVMAVDAWKPGWARWDTFGASRAAAFTIDGLQASRPVEFPVAAPKDAEAMFDVLTYEKGGSVLRMLEQYLTPDVFREGARRFLRAHQYGNAESTDLWRALGEAARQDIPAVMERWIFQAGYPLVTASLEADGRTLRLAQQQFVYRPEVKAEVRWRIPITLRARLAGRTETRRLLLEEAETTLAFPSGVETVVVNGGGHGFYRVRYAGDLWQRLRAAPSETLAPIERFNLVRDAWAATLAGLMPIAAYLDLAASLEEETDRNVWSALFASFGFLARVVRPECRPDLARFVRARLRMLVARLGWEPRAEESERTRQLRGEGLRVAAMLGDDPSLQAEARARYANRHDAADLDPDVAAALIAIVAHAGGPAEYEECLARFRAAATPQDEQRHLRVLAEFRAPDLVGRTLALAASDAVRSQDAPLLFRDLLMGVHSRAQAWAFVRDEWPRLEARFPSLTGMRRMCEGITGLTTAELETDVRAFFDSRQISLGGKTLEQDLEQLRIGVAFAEREAGSLARALAG